MKENKKQFDLEKAIECSVCTCFNTRKFTRVITQIFDDAFKDIGFRGTQFNPLVMIFARGPVSVNKLSDYLPAGANPTDPEDWIEAMHAALKDAPDSENGADVPRAFLEAFHMNRDAMTERDPSLLCEELKFCLACFTSVMVPDRFDHAPTMTDEETRANYD